MTKLCCFAIMVALCVGVVFARMTVAQEDSFPKVRENNLVHTLGPFRDGLYLGRLTAARGEESHISQGRWSNQADRNLFAAGYKQGHDDPVTVQAGVFNVSISGRRISETPGTLPQRREP